MKTVGRTGRTGRFSFIEQTFRYLISGGANTVITLGIFWSLQRLGDGPQWYMGALIVASGIGIVTGFLINGRFAFDPERESSGSFLRYAGVSMANIGLNICLLPLLVEFGGLDPWPAQILATFLCFFVSLIVHRYFTFGDVKAVEEEQIAC